MMLHRAVDGINILERQFVSQLRHASVNALRGRGIASVYVRRGSAHHVSLVARRRKRTSAGQRY